LHNAKAEGCRPDPTARERQSSQIRFDFADSLDAGRFPSLPYLIEFSSEHSVSKITVAVALAW
jgi:hypothetical protein